MKCLCGAEMKLQGRLVPHITKDDVGTQAKYDIHLGMSEIWACSPMGCGRLYMEGTREESGTWYQAETNDRRMSPLR